MNNYVLGPPTQSSLAQTGDGLVTRKRREKADPTINGQLATPMPGTIVAVSVEVGDEVKKGQTLLLISAMKMETEIKAPITCTIERMLVEKGDSAEAGDLLAVIV